MVKTVLRTVAGLAIAAAVCVATANPAAARSEEGPSAARWDAGPAAAAGPVFNIGAGLFINNGPAWSAASSQIAGDRTVTRTPAGPNPGISVSGPTGTTFHQTFGVSRYMFFGTSNHLLILETRAQAGSVTHTVTHVNFATSPPRETLVLTATASSAAVSPPRVQFSQGTGDAFLAYGSTGTELVGIGLSRGDTGAPLCGIPPLWTLNVQLVAEATATQLRIKDGSQILGSCPKPTS